MKKEYKRLKDPVYGYIDIPLPYMDNIIDTDVFQRLRRIIQTSYSPLYSSAVHNRFVHSIGVFHMGEIAVKQLVKEIELKFADELPNENFLKQLEEVFLLACLLHDVGHAPFSHTGEYFYLDSDPKPHYERIHKLLFDTVASNDSLSQDVMNVEAAKPHEIMSAIVGIKEFSEFFTTAEDREFFARCITGYQYSELNFENNIKNCFISMLNSDVIDVDKLDYLIRDAYIIGFDTMSIDYNRLLNAITIVEVYDEDEEDESEDYKLELAYYKSAISIIENVVYAHDAERKWIQNHPIVVYETYILKQIISDLKKRFLKDHEKELFCLETLGTEGVSFIENINIRLMCDDDIIFLMKNLYPSELSEEFFCRKKRRHPLWKSEAEYKAIFLGKASGGDLKESLEKTLSSIAKYHTKKSGVWKINDEFIQMIEKEIEATERYKKERQKIKIRNEKNILKVVKCLRDYTHKKGVPFDLILIQASQFTSGFGKPDFANINIVFPMKDEDDIVTKFKSIASPLNASEKQGENFFYLFYQRKDGKELSGTELCKKLFTELISDDK